MSKAPQLFVPMERRACESARPDLSPAVEVKEEVKWLSQHVYCKNKHTLYTWEIRLVWLTVMGPKDGGAIFFFGYWYFLFK